MKVKVTILRKYVKNHHSKSAPIDNRVEQGDDQEKSNKSCDHQVGRRQPLSSSLSSSHRQGAKDDHHCIVIIHHCLYHHHY